ncbi:MAG: hypothetical protein JW861_01980 [Bacteroidales bacterium]|nr:hypothetical protein [Bacteroidales bacterium]
MNKNRCGWNDNPFFSRGCSGEPSEQPTEFRYHSSSVKLDAMDWLKEIRLPVDSESLDFVEVRFKNSKKDFFKSPKGMKLLVGDLVAVESTPGHDIGIVTLTGEVVRLQMRKKAFDVPVGDMKRVYRHARVVDIEKWVNAVRREDQTMLKTRGIIKDLGLRMKLNDVEYQGDQTKAIFYYTADERVDFRELIKVLAEQFRVRIEMKQIGARQEAARLGGIGSCGRELCCVTWLTRFKSVSTNNARIQQLSLNPQKLAGQCSKLKCCLNFENDIYQEALKEFPDSKIILKTRKGDAEFQKADVFKGIAWYSYLSDSASMMAIPVAKAWDIIKMNRAGNIPEQLEDFSEKKEQKTDWGVQADEEDLRRFDEDLII